jgi:hypothetical protein
MSGVTMSTRRYEVTSPLVHVVHPISGQTLDEDDIITFKEVRLKDWELTMETLDYVKADGRVVQILCHVRVKREADGTATNPIKQWKTFVSDFQVRAHQQTHNHTCNTTNTTKSLRVRKSCWCIQQRSCIDKQRM